MANYYSEVMDILFNDSENRVDYVNIVQDIAKKHPKIVIDAVKQQESHGWKGSIKSLVADGRKIEAIKIWRERTGFGLKDAKEAVEAYVD